MRILGIVVLCAALGGGAWISFSKPSMAEDATITFSYSGTDTDPIENAAISGTGWFSAPVSPVVGLNDLSGFNFSWTASIPGATASINYSLSNLYSFSYNDHASPSTSLSFGTYSVPSSNPLAYPESFSVQSGKGSTTNFTGLSSIGPVTINSVQQSPSKGQVVYVDFGADPNAQYKLYGNPLTPVSVSYPKPAAGIPSAQNPSTIVPFSSNQISQIMAIVGQTYANYNVSFTTQKPTTGNYETVFVGGNFSDIYNPNQNNLFLSPPSNTTIGISQSVNLMDSNPNASAVVLSERIYGFTTPATYMSTLAQTIAHETGHLLGLQHVLPGSELMSPLDTANNFSISSQNVPIAQLNKNEVPVAIPGGFTQNSAADLNCALGGPCNGADTPCVVPPIGPTKSGAEGLVRPDTVIM